MGKTRGIYGTNLQTLKGFNNQRYLRLLVETLFYEQAIDHEPPIILITFIREIPGRGPE